MTEKKSGEPSDERAEDASGENVAAPEGADDLAIEDPSHRETPVATDAVVEQAPDEAAPDTTEDATTPAAGDDAKGAKRRSDATPQVSHAVGDAHIHTNRATIGEIFSGTGEETKPGDPEKSPLWDDELAKPIRNRTSVMVFVATAAVVLVLVIVGYVMLPAHLKADVHAILSGRDIIEERQMREQARVEEERRAMLASAPKFGTVEIVTSPNNLLVTSAGQPSMIFSGTRTDLTQPTRSRVTFKDISVTDDFTFTIHGEGNLEDKTVVIPAFGQVGSPWVQTYSGDYTASLTYMLCLPGQPLPVEEANCLRLLSQPEWRAREYAWRLNWRPDPNDPNPEAIIRLPGTITLRTTPPGALVAFNGRQLIDESTVDPETGEVMPMVTPVTFSHYNAPPDREDRTPLEVYLSREGLPLQIMYEGKASAAFGVYAHQFVCNLKQGAAPPPVPAEGEVENWLGLCDYTYVVEVALADPKPVEGSGQGAAEGSGAAAE